jgi:uridine kinase
MINRITVLNRPVHWVSRPVQKPVLFAASKPIAPQAQLEIRQKLQRMQREMEALIQWDKATHGEQAVFEKVDLKAMLRQSKQFLERQHRRNDQISPYLILIAGGSASGKTYGKNLLLRILEEEAQKGYGWDAKRNGLLVSTLETDMFYRDFFQERREKGDARFFVETNVDCPSAMEMGKKQQTIEKVRKGTGALIPHYNFLNSKQTERAIYVSPAPFFMAEGLFTLIAKSFTRSKRMFHQLADLKLFVNADPTTRVKRWWQRADERGLTGDAAKTLFERTFKMHDIYVEPTKLNAHVVINGAASSEALEESLRRFSRILLRTFYPLQPIQA